MTEREPKNSLLNELQRRRVFRVAGTYTVVAWVLMQAGEIIFPAFELPNSALRILIISLAAGLPIVILLAWLVDVTPSGIRLTRVLSEDDTTHAPNATSGVPSTEISAVGRSLELLLLGIFLPLLSFAVIFLIVQQSAPALPSPQTLSTELGGTTPSLAVLPFEDLSIAGEDDGFFARGVHEDILTRLTRVQPLKLISRTSVMSYEGTTQPLQTIAQELGVNHVLEGSVRRTETKVRVTVQLIRAATDEHVWAKSFDADLTDILRVQSDIAESIATALEANFISGEASTATPIAARVAPAAYDAYFKARDLHRNLDAEDTATLMQAKHLYETALTIDENLATAWLQLGILHAQLHWFGFDTSPKRAERARKSLDRAKSVGVPESEYALAEGILAYYLDHDYGIALLRFSHAVELAPAEAEAYFYQGMVWRRFGELDDALTAQKTALEMDPRNLGYRDEYALTLALAGYLREAREELVNILRTDPDRLRARLQKWQLDLELDRTPRTLLGEMLSSSRSRWQDSHYSMLTTVAILAGEPDAALEAIQARPKPFPSSGFNDYQIALLARSADRPDLAAESIDRASHHFETLLDQFPSALSESASRSVQAALSLYHEEWNQAEQLQQENVDVQPIEQDLIAGSEPLWLLLRIQLEGMQIDAAIETLERLEAHVDPASILQGGRFVLENWPDFATANSNEKWAAATAALRKPKISLSGGDLP